ncbi:MAG TPA: ribosome maturation factor RimM [Acidobacteriaceae bacterium]
MPPDLDRTRDVTPAWVWLAKIRRPQGRKGEVLATILTDFPERFQERKRLWLLSHAGGAQESARPVELMHAWLHKGAASRDIVLHFAGVNSISEAEALAGITVAIPREERAPLGEDEYYAGDLMGCTLVDLSSEPERIVGIIEDVDRESGPVALLVINGGAGKDELLIPWAKAYLRRVDLSAKRVEMALPEGLLQLND